MNINILHKPSNCSVNEFKHMGTYLCKGNKAVPELNVGSVYLCTAIYEHGIDVVEYNYKTSVTIHIPSSVQIWQCVFSPVEVLSGNKDTLNIRYL